MTSTWRASLAGAMVLIAAPALAQSMRGPGERVWIDVNFGLAASAAPEQTFTFTGELFEEPFLLQAQYPKPSRAASVDVGGGVWLTRNIGAGVSFSQATHKDPAEPRIE